MADAQADRIAGLARWKARIVYTPQVLFRGRFVSNARSAYRPTQDGKRFLMLAPPREGALQPATIVLKWTSGLR
jgi:hypothetical protein